MDGIDEAVTCHWITATRLMPAPYLFEADIRPWSCLRDGVARPLTASELQQCAVCPRWLPRGFESVKRDLVFGTWGLDGAACCGSYEQARRRILTETWGGE